MAVFQYYQDKGGNWRWRLRNDEGKIIAVSGQSFKTRDECLSDLETAKQTSEISEVRIYESDEDYYVYKEAPEPETEPEEEEEKKIGFEPEEEPEPEAIEEAKPESEQPEDIQEAFEPEETPVPEEADYEEKERMPEQPDGVPSLVQESSYTAIPEKWNKPNWALITSIVSILVIIVLIILLSLREKPKTPPETLEILSEVQEPTPAPEPPAEPRESMAAKESVPADTVQEMTELEAKVESPELSKKKEPVPIDIYHTVIKGDKLWTLSDEYYSDPFLWPNIYNANTPKIPNPDILKIGIELLIPALEGDHLKLSSSDRRKVAEGYLRAYLVYKELGKSDAKYYLWAAQHYDQSVLAKHQSDIDLEDMQVIKRIKK